MKKVLLDNLELIHTTYLGELRIKKNINIDCDVVKYCINVIKDINSIVNKIGKNYYVKMNSIVFTINSYSYTIITAHIKEDK